MSQSSAFNAFMEGWRDADWPKVRTHLQLTGNHFCYNEQKLAEMLGPVKPIVWEIVSVENVSPVMVDVVANVIFYGGLSKEMRARLVCEAVAFEPDENGVWGVAPLSVLTLRDHDV